MALGVVAAVVAVAGSAASDGAPVFRDVLAPSAAVLDPAQDSAIRQRLAHVDLEQLGDVRRQVREGLPGRMALNLWADAEFEALIDTMARTSTGYSLSGRLAGVRNGAATLVVNGDVVVGTVWTPSALYDIRTVDGVQVLREVDVAALLPLGVPLVGDQALGRRAAGAKSQRPVAADGDAETADDGFVVDILVLWTAVAAKKAGGEANIKALIDLGVASANDAYARSGVDFRLSLVGAEQTDFPDFGGPFYDDAFNEYPNENVAWEEELEAHWDAVFAVRDRVQADIINIVMEMSVLGGFANLMHELSPDFADMAFSFVDPEQIAYNTLAHEVGHNMGLHHDRHVDPVGGIFP